MTSLILESSLPNLVGQVMFRLELKRRLLHVGRRRRVMDLIRPDGGGSRRIRVALIRSGSSFEVADCAVELEVEGRVKKSVSSEDSAPEGGSN